MKVVVVGTGYVGLVAGACFADSGHHVICLDTDRAKVEKLRLGVCPIYEPGLEDILKRNLKSGRISFTLQYDEAIPEAEVIFFAVGTPPLPSGDPDLRYLKSAAESVGKSLSGPAILVNKSTVPIGTHKTLRQWVGAYTQHSFEVVSNPEFLKEGTAVDDFLKPDRVVIGTLSTEAANTMRELYAPFVRQGNPFIVMNPVSAEITKYACNAFLATRISFMNQMAGLCEALGGNIDQVRVGMTSDERIGKHFLYAGSGYGGSCFPKDVQALLQTAKRANVPMGIVEQTEIANQAQKTHLLKSMLKHLGSISGKKIAVWGLAFKPNTDDIREAPALAMIESLLKEGAKISAYDPAAMENVKKIYEGRIECVSSSWEAVQGADALLLMTEWNEFRNVDFSKLVQKLKSPYVFDGRNVFDPLKVRASGLTYVSIGRP